MNFSIKKSILIFSLVVFCCEFKANAQTSATNDSTSELTIYTMPTLHPLDWSSPASLYKSMKNCYLKTITQSDNYLLGHVAVKLKTPLLPKPLLVAQASASARERIDLVLNQKVGFGIMGITLKGRLETEAELNHKLNVYTKREKLAFIKYKISLKAAQRILDFLQHYSTKTNNNFAPCDFYGGAFWPRYHNEGAGCSAFGITLLELANVLPPEANEWKIDVNIPMSIIGGEINQYKKIRNRTIKKTNSWYTGNGKANIDYIRYFVYEPSIMFDWILNKRKSVDSIYKPITENGAPGLIVDASNQKIDDTEAIFVERPEPNLFIDYFYKRIDVK